MRLEVEGAGDQHVETGIGGFAGGLDQIGPLHGAELGTDEDGGAFPSRPPSRQRRLFPSSMEATFGAD